MSDDITRIVVTMDALPEMVDHWRGRSYSDNGTQGKSWVRSVEVAPTATDAHLSAALANLEISERQVRSLTRRAEKAEQRVRELEA